MAVNWIRLVVLMESTYDTPSLYIYPGRTWYVFSEPRPSSGVLVKALLVHRNLLAI
jgi:hypothetical protein